MSNNSIEKNNNIIENINNSINSSSNNVINLSLPLKNSVSDQLLFFKEEILKDLKQFESKISMKYNSELAKNNNKIIKMQETLEEMSQKLEKATTSINSENNLVEKTEKLTNLVSKLEQTSLLQEVKLKNTKEKLTETIDKFNSEISEIILYPTVIGPTGKYKTFHEFIDFVLFNINTLLVFKEKINIEFKDFKNKTESNMNNFQVKLNYQTKNCNAFTTASIRASEQKMGHVWNETLNIELDKISKKWEIFLKNQEEKNLNIIANTERIKTVEQNFEKIETEKNKIENPEMNNIKLKGHKNKNMPGVKKASSIVKQYIEGKLKNDELFKRRRSLQGNINKLKDIKEKMEIKTSHNSYKNLKLFQDNQNNIDKINSQRTIKNNKLTNSEPTNKKAVREESSFNEESESEIDIETERNKIKDAINKLLYKSAKNYKPLKDVNEDKDNVVLNYLRLLYPETPNSINKDNNSKTPEKVPNDNNNDIKLIKDDENIPINKNLYITNNEKISKKENDNNTSFPLTKPKSNKMANIKTLQLSKITPPTFSQNINKKYESNDVKEIINKVKKLNKERLIPIKPPSKKQTPKVQNQIHKNQTLISFTYKPNTRNKIIFKSVSKSTNPENKINSQNNSYNKQNQKSNNITNEIKKLNMNFSSFSENNKENDEQKMKKIFNQIKDVIQEDEKVLIKNRFINYGYKKDIIFAEDKNNIFKKNEDDRNNIFKINNYGINSRPRSKTYKNE